MIVMANRIADARFPAWSMYIMQDNILKWYSLKMNEYPNMFREKYVMLWRSMCMLTTDNVYVKQMVLIYVWLYACSFSLMLHFIYFSNICKCCENN